MVLMIFPGPAVSFEKRPPFSSQARPSPVPSSGFDHCMWFWIFFLNSSGIFQFGCLLMLPGAHLCSLGAVQGAKSVLKSSVLLNITPSVPSEGQPGLVRF